jgi:hypothetical protein
MSGDPKPNAERNYHIGDVGAAARIAQGENISWIEEVAGLPGDESLTRQFQALLRRINADASLSEDMRALSQAKTEAVARGLAMVNETPSILRRALLDAKLWFGSGALWVGRALRDILTSAAAQKMIDTLSDSATKAAIDSFMK